MLRTVCVILLAGLSICNNVSYTSSKELKNIGAYTRAYRSINHHLLDHVGETKDVEAYMKEAKRWYDEEVSKSSDWRLIEALKLFISMDNMKMCTKESTEILVNNDQVLGGGARGLFADSKVATLVEETVNHYATKHARECNQLYSETLHKKFDELGEDEKTNLQIFTEQPGFTGDNDNSYCSSYAFKAIQKLTQNNPDKEYLKKFPNRREGKLELNVPKVVEIFNKYLIEPCQKLVEMNNDDWLKRREFDKIWLKNNEKLGDELMEKFPLRYKICKKMVGSNKHHILQLFVAHYNS